MFYIKVTGDDSIKKEVVDVARKAKVELLKHFPCLEEVLNK